MGFMDKIKNILFEEETVEIPIIKEEKVVNEVREQQSDNEIKSRFKGINRDIGYEKSEEKEVSVNPVRKEEVIEKKDQKSPFISFDEDEFEMITSYREKKNYEEKKPEKKVERDRDSYKSYKENNRKIDYYSGSRKAMDQKKKFKPSLVISPVYGVLDKNYKKDDVLPTASSEGTLPKIMDVDSVRRKAFGTLEDEIENNLAKTKEYKIVDEHKTIGELIEENLNNDEVPHYNTEEIKITSYMDNEEDDDNTTLDDLIEKEKVEEIRVDDEVSSDKKDILDDIKIDKEENEEKDESNLENDLFDLIDSMYENREEEEK